MSAAGAAAPLPTGGAREAERRMWLALGLAALLILLLALRGGPANLLLGLLVAGLVLVAFQDALLDWRTMLGVILAIILFVPIRRYTVAGNLPVELEPYRVAIIAVLLCWFCALLADPKVRWRRTGLEWPIAALVCALLLSMAANLDRIDAAGSTVIKNFTFFVSYLLVVFFIASVVRSRRDLDLMLRLIVAGGAIVAATALVEWKTTTNFYNWYGHVLPFLHYVDEGVAQARGSGVRARGSAQHPIALSAALVMLVPIAFYLWRRDRSKLWLGCLALLTLGALSTGSRTGTTMLIAVALAFLAIRPRETLRLAPLLPVMLVLIQVVMPGTLGTMRSMLSPSYLAKEQSYDEGATAGRAADLGPALDRWSRKPLLGSGFGTTVADPNAPKESEQQILDDQWLGSLLETGAVGVLALFALFATAIRRLTRVARNARDADDGWLATALAASLISFAVGMFTFDAFAFIQVTFFAFVTFGFAAVLMRPRGGGSHASSVAA